MLSQERPDERFFGGGRALWIWSRESRCLLPDDRSCSHYEVRRFRKTFDLDSVQQTELRVACSADSRYILYLNGERVGRGPAKGDIHHHFFEVYDLSSHLQPGRNVLAALVMDYSKVQTHALGCNGAPASVMTDSGAFLLDAVLSEGRGTTHIATDGTWKVQIDRAYRFHQEGNHYAAVTGYHEDVHCDALPARWTEPDFDDGDWEPATAVLPPVRFDERRDSPCARGLIERMIPALEESGPYRFASAFLPGGNQAPADWESLRTGEAPARIASNTRISVLLDAGRLTTAYPELSFRGGAGATVRLTYAEALRHEWGIEDMVMVGHQVPLDNVAHVDADISTGWTFDHRGYATGMCDIVRPDGREHFYDPFHWRTFQFVRLDIETGAEPLELVGFSYRFTAYPYESRAKFECDDPQLDEMQDISWRTIRLCTHETFEDCPYYEQLQYAGDTQIISRIATLVSGDTRLTRQALYHFDWSRLPEGITRSSYPNRIMNVIPSWSLQWIAMAADYYQYTADRDTVRSLLPGIRAVLDWFGRHRDASGLPSRLPYWNYIDWCTDWLRGQAPGWESGPTLGYSTQFLHALHNAARLEEACGETQHALARREEAHTTAALINEVFWNEEAGLYYDQPEHESLSQLGNAWAVISGAASPERYDILAERFPHDPALARPAFFGMYFVFRALSAMDRYDHAYRMLDTWRDMMGFGLSTWPEDTTFWRSLCHAWSALPLHELLTEILGIEPAAPGWARARIAPRTCGLLWARGAVPTPHGLLSVGWTTEGDVLHFSIDIPAGLAAHIVIPGLARHDHPAMAETQRLHFSAPVGAADTALRT